MAPPHLSKSMMVENSCLSSSGKKIAFMSNVNAIYLTLMCLKLLTYKSVVLVVEKKDWAFICSEILSTRA